MDKKLDLRIQKTYLALTNTFLQMMKEMRFEDIRVSELCERAMIRKSTFYKHFGDKYELLAFIVRQTQENFDAQLAESCSTDNIIDYYTTLINLVFDYLEENTALVQSTLQSNSLSLILDIISEQIIQDIKEKIKKDALRGEKLPADPGIMATFFVGGIMQTACAWLKQGKPLDEQELKDQLGMLLRQFYQTASIPNA
ncbi:MAG: TetR/AcrR family transcriptional regulator C-terminal domain-containing protein [Peptococcaceae bacterium]|nr:TetR/AcrR family transcriptional regulator C-terminal domain-containing protein [Peptococcaceae bacterium]